jgi:hypothetical protein
MQYPTTLKKTKMNKKIFKILTASGIIPIALILVASCTKKTLPVISSNTSNYPVITDSVYNPVDPVLATTIGFFQQGWTARTFTDPVTDTAGAPSSLVATDSLTIDVNKVLVKASPYLFGNNSNLWMGQIVTQPVLMQYIKDLSPNIIRAPAGSISDVYFWNGTPSSPKPADAPDSLLGSDGSPGPIGSWYGGNTQSYTLSLANYYNLLAQTNSTGIITINYGYARYGTSINPVAAAAHLAADWVRYDNGRTKFWEIGNESYGNWEAGYLIDTALNQDGQPAVITGALYGAHVIIFADSMRAAAKQLGLTIYIGATLYQQAPSSGDNITVQNWNQGVLANAGSIADYFIVHDYFTAYATNSTLPAILSTGTSVPLSVMSFLQQQIISAGVGIKPIAMTEWNIQATGSKQNTSYIAGIHAALTVGAFLRNQFGEASRWDLANGYANGDDQGMFNIGDEPNAPLWNPRPSFYYLYYFQKYFGDRMVYDTLRRTLNNPDITTYSSTFSSGQAGTVIINSGSGSHIVSVDFQHFPAGSQYYWYVLTGGSDNAPFSSQVYVNGTGPSSPSGGPLNYATLKPYTAPLKGTIKLTVPALAVVYLVADKK